MKVLIDEDLPTRLRLLIAGHDVVTVQYAGWKSLKNGELLKAAEAADFQVFVTGDKKLVDEQRISGRPFGVVVLSAQKMEELRPYVEEINAAIGRTRPGTVELVLCTATKAT